MIGTFFGVVHASFGNTAINSSSIFSSGAINLRTNDAYGTIGTISAAGASQSGIIGPTCITVKNSGVTDGSTFDISFSYTKNGNIQQTETSATLDELAAELTINTLAYNDVSLLNIITDSNSNNQIDVEDAAKANLCGLAGIKALDSKYLIIQLSMKNASDDLNSRNIDIGITFTLNK
jgi:hypothetical protein